jgi:hypothetical protein
MSRYTIEVAPEDPDGSGVTFTLQVDSAGISVMSMVVRLPQSGDLPSDELSRFDFQTWMAVAASALDGQRITPVIRESQVNPPSDMAPHVESRIEKIATQARVSVGKPKVDNRSVSTSKPGAGAPPDIGVTYWRLGTIGKVAKHYGVPNRIASDWIAELRRNGDAPSRWPKQGRVNAKSKRPRH